MFLYSFRSDVAIDSSSFFQCGLKQIDLFSFYGSLWAYAVKTILVLLRHSKLEKLAAIRKNNIKNLTILSIHMYTFELNAYKSILSDKIIKWKSIVVFRALTKGCDSGFSSWTLPAMTQSPNVNIKEETQKDWNKGVELDIKEDISKWVDLNLLIINSQERFYRRTNELCQNQERFVACFFTT